MEQEIKEIKEVMALAKAFAERHQIHYSDYHERMVLMVISETIKMAGRRLVKPYNDAIAGVPDYLWPTIDLLRTPDTEKEID